MSGVYEIVWQVQTDRPELSRKDCQGGGDCFFAPHSYEGILDGFDDPEVADLGEELVIWQRLPNGALAAEGWRKIRRRRMKRYVFEVGDGVNPRKDFSVEYTRIPDDDEFKNTVALVLWADPDAERLIEDAEIDRDETGAVLIVNEGPNGECAPNGGPWLVARVEEVVE